LADDLMGTLVAVNPQLHRGRKTNKEVWIENKEARKRAAEIAVMGVEHRRRCTALHALDRRSRSGRRAPSSLRSTQCRLPDDTVGLLEATLFRKTQCRLV